MVMSDSAKDGKRHSAGEEFALCVGIAFAYSVLNYEMYIPEYVMKIYRAVVFALLAAAWLWFSFVNGYRRSLIFPTLISSFWLLCEFFLLFRIVMPGFITEAPAYRFISDCADMIIAEPALVISKLTGFSMIISRLLICALCLFMYFAGFLISKTRINALNRLSPDDPEKQP
jgi:hypothetical protein